MKALVGHLWDGLRHHLDALVLLDEIDSTHGLALRLIEQLDTEALTLRSALVVARSQSQGRGRGHNRWASPPGGLYLSWIRFALTSAEISSLPIAAAAAATRAVAGLGLGAVEVKWPNDLVVGGAKLGGILTHARHGPVTWVTVGLGVNLTRTPTGDELEGKRATSVADHLPERQWEEWAGPLAVSFVRGLEEGLARPHLARDEWQRRLVHRAGELLEVRLGSGEMVSGRFAGLTDEGFLRLATGPDHRVITTGELVDKASAEPTG